MFARNFPAIRPYMRRPQGRMFPHRRLATATATDKLPAASPHPGDVDHLINKIVDDISGLTLLQAADLVAALKSRLNIQEVAAPVAAAPSVAHVEAADAPTEDKPKEKTIFTVKLESFETSAKSKIIREVKALIPNLNLIDAKKFVESVPKTLKENLPKEDAQKLRETFEKLGAKVVLE